LIKIEIPTRLQCAYCERNDINGGECKAPYKTDGACLAFKRHKYGALRRKKIKMTLPIGHNVTINEWVDDYECKGHDTMVRVKRIYHVGFTGKRMILVADVDFYVNDYAETEAKPVLKLVKK